MEIFVIGSVRNATDEQREAMEEYVANLETQGHSVHLPHRDTNQQAKGIDICTQNAEAIENCDEVHLFYNSNSTGSHFDMGIAWGLNKPLIVVGNVEYNEGKSFARMANEWQERGVRKNKSILTKKIIMGETADDTKKTVKNSIEILTALFFVLIGLLSAYFAGVGDTKKEAIKANVAYYDSKTGEFKFGAPPNNDNKTSLKMVDKIGNEE